MVEQNIVADALDNLRVHQRQLDADGCEVGVSRQALNEAITYIGRLSADRDFWKERFEVGTKARIEAQQALSRTGAVKVKPLDLSNLLRHAFFEGFMIAGGSQEAAAEWWPEYDPETCPAYSRILSTLEPAPEAQQESVVVSVADINTWRAEWMDANDPQDGTDCVTPFDKYLYTRPTHGRRR